jgi:CheY-like chemotaxis protein
MPTILILDDDAVSALVIEEMLIKQGHQVKTAARCADAWAEMRDGRIDILILDTDLGTEKGWEFLERIRADFVLATFPVVVCSGISQRDVVQRYLKLGIQGMIVKPSTSERLASELGRAQRTPWRDAVLVPADVLQTRGNLSAQSVGQIYRKAADEIWATLGQCAVLAQEPFNAPAISRVLALKGCALSAGCTALERMVTEVLKAYNKLNPGPIRATLEGLPVIMRLMRQRADALAPLAEKPPAEPAAPAPVVAPLVTSEPAASPEAAASQGGAETSASPTPPAGTSPGPTTGS